MMFVKGVIFILFILSTIISLFKETTEMVVFKDKKVTYTSDTVECNGDWTLCLQERWT